MDLAICYGNQRLEDTFAIVLPPIRERLSLEAQAIKKNLHEIPKP